MTKTSKKNKATHTTRSTVAKLETPKGNPGTAPKHESASLAAPINLTGGHMTQSIQIKEALAEGKKHTWFEEDDETGCLHEDFCDLLNEIERRPDAERQLAKVRTVLEILAGGAELAQIKMAHEEPAVEVDSRAEWQKRILSDAEANNLAEELFGAAEIMPSSKEADDLAGVVMKIISLFTYEESLSNRESNANFLSLAIYARTADCSYKMDEFAKKSAA